MKDEPVNDDETGCVPLMVLVNHRNYNVENRKKHNGKVFCFVIRCTFNQFVKGAPYEEALSKAKLHIHKEFKLSSEDFDFLVFDRSTGHFVSKKVWKMDSWENSEVVDISDRVTETESED